MLFVNLQFFITRVKNASKRIAPARKKLNNWTQSQAKLNGFACEIAQFSLNASATHPDLIRTRSCERGLTVLKGLPLHKWHLSCRGSYYKALTNVLWLSILPPLLAGFIFPSHYTWLVSRGYGLRCSADTRRTEWQLLRMCATFSYRVQTRPSQGSPYSYTQQSTGSKATYTPERHMLISLRKAKNN